MAWLHATPEGAKKSRRETLLEGGEGSPLLTMPELNESAYIIDLWHEAGTVASGGMGLSPLSWTEIKNWIDAVELDLSTWELLTIKFLSSEYCSEYGLASDKNRAAPFEEIEDIDREALGSKFKNILRGFASKEEER